MVQRSWTARSFSTLHLIHYIHLFLDLSSWFIITEHIFCLLPSLVVFGVQLHSEVIPSFCFAVQTLLQEWGKYSTSQLMPELTASQLGDWVAQWRHSSVLHQKWPHFLVEMVCHGDVHFLLCVLQKQVTKRYPPSYAIHSGKGGEGINILPLKEFLRGNCLAYTACGRDRHYFCLWSLGTIFYWAGCIFSFILIVPCIHWLGLCIRGRTRREGAGW